MNLAFFLSSYLTLNFLLLTGFLILFILLFTLRSWNRPLSFRNELGLHYFVISLALGLSFAVMWLPANSTFAPIAKVWSAPSLKSFSSIPIQDQMSGFIGFNFPAQKQTWKADTIASGLGLGFMTLILIGLFKLSSDLQSLRRIRNKSFLLRRIGRVQIHANESISVPFSYRLWGQAHIVVPCSILEKGTDFRIAVLHELQHHRQGDTLWVYIIWTLRGLCLVNPAIHLWDRWISEIQEFSCDETLVDRNKVDSQEYARCLVEVAQSAINQHGKPVCATGVTCLIEAHLLKRRIENMFTKTQFKNGRALRIGIAALMMALLAGTASASKNLIQDRRVSLQQATVMAEKAQSESADLPIFVNELVLKELNRYIGTADGREYMKKALSRMQDYQPMIEEKIKQYQVPAELIAIPIIESAYQNLPQDPNHHSWGAGLWMFIESTAAKFGLMDNHSDHRQIPDLETIAAMRYLKSNELQFSDWWLAILSYNMGEEAVRKAMKQTGDKDAWALVRHGIENDHAYLPRVMAAILIMKNPDCLN